MTITSRDLIQVNATLIAGLLIFLTVSVVQAPIILTEEAFPLFYKVAVRMSILVPMTFFIMSLHSLLSNSKEYSEETKVAAAKDILRIGLMLLIISVAIILVPFTFE